jgi:hypothetical protein
MSAPRFVLWGFLPGKIPAPIKITGGNLRQCHGEQTRRIGEGWTCGIYAPGDAPTGLRDQAREVAESAR